MRKFIGLFLLVVVPLASCSETKKDDRPEAKSPRNGPANPDHPRANPTSNARTAEVGTGSRTKGSAEIAKELLDQTGSLTTEQKQSAIFLVRSGDIETCKKLLESMPIGPFYETLLGEFAERYAKEDLVASIQWMKQLPPEGHLQKGYSAIGRNAALNPSVAEDFIRSTRDEGLKAEFSAGYLLGLSQQKDDHSLQTLLGDPQRLASLGLDNGIVFDTIVRGGAAHASLDQSLDTIERLMRAGIIPKAGVANMAIKQISSSDPAKFASFLAANPDLPEISRIASPALEAWGASDPIKAAEWLKSQQGVVRDAGTAGLAKSVARSEPQSAVTWAISIEDPVLRAATLTQIASYSKFEREQIRSIIQNSGFDQETKDSYLGIFR